ncbi:MAG: hypothetical protein OJF51_001153 [Nitrospira sp.]|nr:MAG: hypothetical protein OJF51_001153 [Nitrospira sp.]
MKQHLAEKAATVEPGRARRGTVPMLSETQPGATRHPIFQLQGTIGNQAVNRLLQSGRLPTKLPVSLPDDTPVQRQESDEKELLQSSDEALQKRPGAPAAPPAQHPNRTGLPDNLKSGIESLSGMSLDNVRVHYNSSQPAQLNALAYTHGADIHVAPGQEQHLPHEAWHVVQQAQGRVRPTIQLKEGMPVNDDQGLEHEADVMGKLAAASGSQGESQDARLDISSKSEGVAQQHVVQRVRGGIEYTEDGPTELHAYPKGEFRKNVPRYRTFTVNGKSMTGFRVGAGVDDNDTLGRWTNTDFDVVCLDRNVRLTNDVVSAEWIIERHQNDLAPDVMRQTLKEDIGFMFKARDELAAAVGALKSGYEGQVAVTDGIKNDTSGISDDKAAFIYRVGPKKGKAQITAQYSNEETIRRINKLNVSKFLIGTKVAEGEDVARISGTESRKLQQADIAGATSFSTAGVLLDGLASNSRPIPLSGGGGYRLTQAQVGLVKLMVLNDALATTMVRYQDLLGQAQEKNIQRFFPKSRRDEYVKTVAQADLDASEMDTLRNEILRTSSVDAQLLFNKVDPAALRTDEAFTELVASGTKKDAEKVGHMTEAKRRLIDPAGGAADRIYVAKIKEAVLGHDGTLLALWIKRAARAYTDTSSEHMQHYRNLTSGSKVGNVIETSRGFTPVQGRGAIYEMREREISIDRSGWLNIGSMKEMNDAIDKIFGAAD